jgi:uncharacterized membrane protein YhhN
MIPLLIILPAAVLLTLLLLHEKRGNRKTALAVKTVLSLLFVAAAAVQPRPVAGFFLYVFAGLILCLAGDVFLALPEKFFKAGLAAFLLGHGFYILGFAAPTKVRLWFSPGALFFVVLGAAVFLWLRPRLGAMLGPVLAYVAVITVMVAGAWAVFREPAVPAPGRWLVLTGAVAFYLSDVFVARNKFIRNEFLNRLVGLPLYYLGQFLLAFSVGRVG